MSNIIEFPINKSIVNKYKKNKTNSPNTYIGNGEDAKNIKVNRDNIIQVNFNKEATMSSFEEHVRYIISLVVHGAQGCFVPCKVLITEDKTMTHTGPHYWETTSFSILKDVTTITNHQFEITEEHLEKVAEFFAQTGLQFQWETNTDSYRVSLRCLITEEQLIKEFGVDNYKKMINQPFELYNPIIKDEDTDAET